MQGQRGQDFETAARGRHSFRFLGPRPNDRLSHPVKEAAYRAAIHLNPQRGVERLAHFLQAALGIALMRAPQERLRLGGEFATISLTPPVQETGEALGRQAGLVTKILWPTKGHRVSAEKLVHGQIGSSDLFYHRCDLLGSAFPAGRGPVHPPQHSLNMAIWPACSAVFVRSWGIKRYNWTMLFRGEDSSSSWLLIISSTDSFLRARESRSYVELRSGPVSANCNSPKYQTIVMYYPEPAQWDVTHHAWRPYFVAKGTDWWEPFYPPDNRQRPTGPTCDGCHSVDYDIRTKQVAEWNVGCERCHGPGSEHAAHPTRGNIIDPAEMDYVDANDTCIQCHSQGRPVNNPMEGKYYDWPVGYRVGLRLRDFWQLEEHTLGQTTFTHFADGTAHKNRMQGNDFVQSLMYRRGITCFTCHDVQGTGNYAQLRKRPSSFA